MQLGARGVATVLEIDTNHFKGNYPDRCSVDWIDAPGARITDLVASPRWSPLLPETRLAAHARQFLRAELASAQVPRDPCAREHLSRRRAEPRARMGDAIVTR